MTDAMSTERVRYEEPAPHVARIVLARPEKRNAQDRAMLYALDDAYRRAVANTEIRVIVIAADGPDFSSGHDLSDDFAVPPESARGLTGGFDAEGIERWYAREEELFAGLCLRWRDVPRPTIAQVQGRVIGGGLMIVWPCDLIVASEDASFVDPVAAFGMNGHEYFTHTWELGARRAKEMLYTGEAIGAADALAMGMVNRVVARDRLEEETLALAEKIARRPPFGLRLAKRAVNQALDLQGQRTAVLTAFDAHVLLHAHNQVVHGAPLDPAGVDVIRRDAKASAANRNGA